MRQLKSTFLQPFVIQDKTARLPVQQLDLIADFIDKNVHRSIIGVLLQVILYQSTQAVKALAHIGRMRIQVKTVRTTQGKHHIGISISTPLRQRMVIQWVDLTSAVAVIGIKSEVASREGVFFLEVSDNFCIQ